MPIKNSIKIGSLFGIIVSFFTYPMEDCIVPRPLIPKLNDATINQDNTSDNLSSKYTISLDDIKKTDLFSKMKNLAIYCRISPDRSTLLSDNHSLFTNENLPISLSIIQAIEEPDPKKRSQILKAIGTAVTRGAPLASSYNFLETSFTNTKKVCFKKMRLSDENLYSVFETMENWIHKVWIGKKLQLIQQAPKNYIYNWVNKESSHIQKSSTDAKNSIMQTIFEAADRRKTYIDYGLKKNIDDSFEINIPQAILFLIFSWLYDEKNKDLIEQIRQEFEPE